MELENFIKAPVHEVVESLPTNKPAGYRCINLDDGCIYEFNADGTYTKDDTQVLGAQCSVIGSLGDRNHLSKFIKNWNIALQRTPFFGTGNTKNLALCCIWGDKLAIARVNPGANSSDIIVITADGDTWKTSSSLPVAITGMCVDSHYNLWVSTVGGLLKLSPQDPNLYFTSYTTATNNIPFDNISSIIADGNELWIIRASGADFNIAHYDGYDWIERTAQFKTDLSIEGDPSDIVLYKLVSDDDDLVLFSCNDANYNKRLYYFSKSNNQFYKKDLPSTFDGSVIMEFVKVGSRVYGIKAAAGAKTGGPLVVWDWSTLDVIYEEDDVEQYGTWVNTDGVTVLYHGLGKVMMIQINEDEPRAMDQLVTDLESKLSDGSTIHLISAAISGNTLVFLNVYDTGEVYINDILKGTLANSWVTVNLDSLAKV